MTTHAGSIGSKVWRVLGDRRLLLVLRLIVGLTLIFSAAGALPHQAEFVSVVQAHGILPGILASIYGSVLPWLELLVGAMLVVGLFTRFAAWVTLLMVVSFLVANGTSVYHNVKSWSYDCGCFHWVTLKTGNALLVDVVLIIFAIALILRPQGLLDLDRRLRRMFGMDEPASPRGPGSGAAA